MTPTMKKLVEARSHLIRSLSMLNEAIRDETPTPEDLQRVDKHYGIGKKEWEAIVAEQSNVNPS